MSHIALTSVSDPVAVEPVDSWRPEANIYESGEILRLASFPVPQPGHCARKAEPNELIQSKEKLVEGLQPVILGLRLLQDYLFHCNRCSAGNAQLQLLC